MKDMNGVRDAAALQAINELCARLPRGGWRWIKLRDVARHYNKLCGIGVNLWPHDARKVGSSLTRLEAAGEVERCRIPGHTRGWWRIVGTGGGGW